MFIIMESQNQHNEYIFRQKLSSLPLLGIWNFKKENNQPHIWLFLNLSEGTMKKT